MERRPSRAQRTARLPPVRSSMVVLGCLLLPAVPLAAAPPVSADAAYRFTVAQSLVHEGSYRDALETFEEVVRLAPEEPYVRLEYAELLFRLRRWREAAEQARAARELAPRNVNVLRLVGQVELNLSENDPAALDRAREALEEVRALAPDDREAMASLGQILLSQGRASEAADLFAELLDYYPGDRMLVSLLIDSLKRSERDAELEPILKTYLEQDPGFLKVRMLLARLQSERGDHEAAAETLRPARGEAAGEGEVQRRLALELYRAGESGEALEAIDEALEAEPEDVQLRYLRGLILADLGRLEEAEAMLEELAAEQPENLELRLVLAQLRERGGDAEAAVSGLEAAIRELTEAEQPARADAVRLELANLGMRSGDWLLAVEATEPLMGREDEVGDEARLLRADALRELARTQEALATVEAIDDDSPLAPRAAARAAELLFLLEREGEARERLDEIVGMEGPEGVLLAAEVLQRLERHGEAIPLLLEAREREPSQQVAFWLGAAYERTGRFEEAEVEFRRLLEDDPDFAPALNYLGYMWAEQGENLEEALELILRAVSLDPGNGAYIDSLGWAYFQLGRYEEARDQLERAAVLVPDDAVVVEHLGDLYRAVGDPEGARVQYLRAVELGGENLDEVRRKLDQLDGSR